MSNNARNSTMNNVMTQLGNRAAEIANMLPPDLPVERFQANILNALRNTPAILDATPNSIIKACMKAAYDGLRLDGKEAAIVVHENTYGQGADARKVKDAEYFPMAFGLIQQVLRGGEVKSVYAEVIRENDEYVIRRGTNPGIDHDINLHKPRGEIIGAYSVAVLMNGAVTFEILDRHDLAEIKKAAKTKKVWDRWPGEMSKKSAVRRHRKTLPLGDRDIIVNDSEAQALYPDMDPGRESLPAPAQRREAPTRAAIADRQGTEAGAPLDLGHDEDGVVIDQGGESEEKSTDRANVNSAGESKQAKDLPETDNSGETLNSGDMPEGDEEWREWSIDVERRITDAEDPDTVTAIAKEEEARIDAAGKERADFIRGLITDRLADFATGGA